MNGGQLNITLKTPLDVLYFNNDKTQLQECLNQFLSEDVSCYQLAQKQSRQAIIDDFFNGYKNTIHPDLYAAFSSTLRKAVSGVFGNDPENRFSDLKDKLISNVSRFAAYKAYHCSRVIDRQRATEDGELVSKKEFEELANKVISTYNRWQAAEYNTAVTRARTAKQFTVFNEPHNVRLFPCLRWIPSRSVEQRDEHKPFYNLVLPKDHPFWQSNQPGNLWNCKCDWEETNAQQSKGYPKTKINSQGLEGNPATTGEVFTDRHTYFAKAPKKIKIDSETAKQFKNLQNLFDIDTKKWRLDYYTDNEGYLQTNRLRIEEQKINKQEKAKFDKEYSMCRTLALNKFHVVYRQTIEGSFDIFLNGIPCDLKKTKSHNNFVDYALKAVNEQGAKLVVIEFEKETKKIHLQIDVLKRKGIKGFYFFSNAKTVIYSL